MSHSHEIPELDAAGLRHFGLLTGGIIAALFGLFFPWLLEHDWPRWPWVVAGVLGAWALIAPASLRPVYKGWMRFGMLLSRVTTPLVMILTFIAVIVPAAVIKRVFGKDSMARRLDTSAKSYRVTSKKAPPENLEKPY